MLSVAACCCGEVGCLPCSLCQIPQKNLTFSWVNISTGNGSGTLVFSAPHSWFYPGIPGRQNPAHLSCLGSLEFCIDDPISGGHCCEGSTQLFLVDYTCNPLHLHYRFSPGSLSGICSTLRDLQGYTDFYIDDPGPLTPCLLNCVTCGGDMPTDLFVTDVLGTYAATWAGSYWITPVLCCPVTVGGGNIDGVGDCVAGVPTCHAGLVSGNAAYRYVISCHSATELLISRNWLELYPACIQYAPCGCVDFLGGSNIAAIATVTCGAISASVTLGGGSSNLGDPLFKNNPGTNTAVSFSQ